MTRKRESSEDLISHPTLVPEGKRCSQESISTERNCPPTLSIGGILETEERQYLDLDKRARRFDDQVLADEQWQHYDLGRWNQELTSELNAEVWLGS